MEYGKDLHFPGISGRSFRQEGEGAIRSVCFGDWIWNVPAIAPWPSACIQSIMLFPSAFCCGIDSVIGRITG